MYKIGFYVPEQDVELVKSAMFEAGAGQIGNYEHCAWQALGSGQFMPQTGSHPYIGTDNQIERIAEYRVEMVCKNDCIQSVVDALRRHHPYEEPAYDVIRLEDF